MSCSSASIVNFEQVNASWVVWSDIYQGPCHTPVMELFYEDGQHILADDACEYLTPLTLL